MRATPYDIVTEYSHVATRASLGAAVNLRMDLTAELNSSEPPPTATLRALRSGGVSCSVGRDSEGRESLHSPSARPGFARDLVSAFRLASGPCQYDPERDPQVETRKRRTNCHAINNHRPNTIMMSRCRGSNARNRHIVNVIPNAKASSDRTPASSASSSHKFATTGEAMNRSEPGLAPTPSNGCWAIVSTVVRNATSRKPSVVSSGSNG